MMNVAGYLAGLNMTFRRAVNTLLGQRPFITGFLSNCIVSTLEYVSPRIGAGWLRCQINISDHYSWSVLHRQSNIVIWVDFSLKLSNDDSDEGIELRCSRRTSVRVGWLCVWYFNNYTFKSFYQIIQLWKCIETCIQFVAISLKMVYRLNKRRLDS